MEVPPPPAAWVAPGILPSLPSDLPESDISARTGVSISWKNLYVRTQHRGSLAAAGAGRNALISNVFLSPELLVPANRITNGTGCITDIVYAFLDWLVRAVRILQSTLFDDFPWSS